jgi:hypothetical protein
MRVAFSVPIHSNCDCATCNEKCQHGYHRNDEVLHSSFTRMSCLLTGREEHQRAYFDAFTRRRVRRERIFERGMERQPCETIFPGLRFR